MIDDIASRAEKESTMEAIIVFALVAGLGAFGALATRSAHDRALRPDDPAIGSYGVTHRASFANVAPELRSAQHRRVIRAGTPNAVAPSGEAACAAPSC